MPDEVDLSFVFYVSGHGLGHLTRCAEVARALLRTRNGAAPPRRVTFVTNAANCEVLGTREVDGEGGVCRVMQLSEEGVEVGIRDRRLDAGARQRDAFCIDIDETRDGALAFHRDIDMLIAEEVRWLRESRPDVVVSDVVGLAFPAARQAGVPVVLMTNFSWGFIYRPFIREGEDDGAFRSVVGREEEMVGQADGFLRLAGFSVFGPRSLESVAVDVPLIARPIREGREAMRSRLRIDEDAKVCLLMTGGHSLGVDFDWQTIGDANASSPSSSWLFFVTASMLDDARGEDLPPNVRLVPPKAYVPDFVAMADVVIGKIGYGTVSECLSSRTPLVYVPRENFCEEEDLRKLLERQLAGLEMPRETFLAGDWCNALSTALQMRPAVLAIDTDGARIAAAIIVDAAERKKRSAC